MPPVIPADERFYPPRAWSRWGVPRTWFVLQGSQDFDGEVYLRVWVSEIASHGDYQLLDGI